MKINNDAFPRFRKTTKHSVSGMEPTDEYAGTVYAFELLLAAANAAFTWYIAAVEFTIHYM